MRFPGKLIKFVYHEWYYLAARTRALMLLVGCLLVLLGILGIFGYELLFDRDRWTFLYGLGVLLNVFALITRVLPFLPPPAWAQDPKRITALKGRDLELLEILIESGATVGDGDSVWPDLYQLVEGHSWPYDHGDFQGRLHDRKLLASLRSLCRAGLVEDLRKHFYDEYICVRVYIESADALEREQARRSLAAARGPRSRLGPLAA